MVILSPTRLLVPPWIVLATPLALNLPRVLLPEIQT